MAKTGSSGQESASGRAKSADRALRIIELLARNESGLTFTDVSNELKIPRSSTHELLAVLLDHSFADYDATTRTYRLGIRSWETGQSYIGQRQLVTEAEATMSAIASALDETVQLAVLDGLEEVYVGRVDSSHPLRIQAPVGTRVPAHVTALGKVLLAELRDAELLNRLRGQDLVAHTPHTITTVEELVDELRDVRAVGFALDDEEYATGLRCVAVPIRDHTSEAVAAISVATPLGRSSNDQLAKALAVLIDGAAGLSRRLGYPQALALRGPANEQELRQVIGERLESSAIRRKAAS